MTWKSLISNPSYYFSDLIYSIPFLVVALVQVMASLVAMQRQVQTFWSGNLLNYFLCQSWSVIKPQSAAWTCRARQALVSCVSDTSRTCRAQCSAGSILLLEEVQCQACDDYALLQKQWVETDGKGCCLLAHLLSINLLLDVPSHLPVVTL